MVCECFSLRLSLRGSPSLTHTHTHTHKHTHTHSISLALFFTLFLTQTLSSTLSPSLSFCHSLSLSQLSQCQSRFHPGSHSLSLSRLSPSKKTEMLKIADLQLPWERRTGKERPSTITLPFLHTMVASPIGKQQQLSISLSFFLSLSLLRVPHIYFITILLCPMFCAHCHYSLH